MNNQTFDEYLQVIHNDIRARDKDTIRLSNAVLRFPSDFDSRIRPGDDVMVVHLGWIGKALYTMDGMPGWWVVARPGERNRSVRERDITVIGKCSPGWKLLESGVDTDLLS